MDPEATGTPNGLRDLSDRMEINSPSTCNTNGGSILRQEIDSKSSGVCFMDPEATGTHIGPSDLSPAEQRIILQALAIPREEISNVKKLLLRLPE